MADQKEIVVLARIIDAVARKCWRGLPALLGKAPPPTREQIREALFYTPSGAGAAGRVKGTPGEGREFREEDRMIDEYDTVLEQISWKDLSDTVQWFSRNYRRDWGIYVNLISASEVGRSYWGIDADSPAKRLAAHFGLSESTLYEIARETPLRIARAAGFGVKQLNLFDLYLE